MHELDEIAGNPYLLEWRRVPPAQIPGDMVPSVAELNALGLNELQWRESTIVEQPRETADVVQNDGYYIDATVFGETRSILATNAVGQRYFGEDAPDHQALDLMNRLHNPGQLGNGYRVLKKGGVRSYEYGWSRTTTTMAARKFGAASRSHWLIRGKGFTVEEHEGGYVAGAPLPGCTGLGSTPEAALFNARSLVIKQQMGV